MRKRNVILLVFLLSALLAGCGKQTSIKAEIPTAAAETETTTQAPTVPPDGNPNDVTCKGSYTAEVLNTASPVAAAGEGTLSAQALQSFYALEVFDYLSRQPEVLPDLTHGLDTQPCPIDTAVNSWQQYFLKQALHRWHAASALRQKSQADGLPVEEAFQPDPEKYEECMTDMPADKILYRYEKAYSPNSMHQAYLDAMEGTLSELAAQFGYSDAAQMAQAMGTDLPSLTEAANTYNFGYMYLTTMGDYLLPEDAQEAVSDNTSTPWVNIRHILLKPEDAADEKSWDNREKEAEKLLSSWQRSFRTGEGSFAEMAYANSQEEATVKLGGEYDRVTQGQLPEDLAAWCFDPERQAGEATVLRNEQGIHMLYLAKQGTQAQSQAEDAAFAQNLRDFAAQAMEDCPLTVSYDKITLQAPELSHGGPGYEDILYPDIAHERFPEIPLYLQQDYGNTKYGNYYLRSHGCGITSLSMLASYMTDTELTPPMLCARYGNYCHSNGTDAMIFIYEPPVLGFYLKKQTFDKDEALQALEDGYTLISSQTKGYWTRGGHYIVLEKIDKDGVQVRDSNILNYKRLPAHKVDRHAWGDITYRSTAYWIYEKKQTRHPLCTRCGDPESVTETIFQGDYLCCRCDRALTRRNLYLSL